MAQVQSVADRRHEYETIYILRPDVMRDNAAKVATRVEEVVGRGGGALTLVETWGRRQLAYPVKKFKRGVYVYLRYVSGGGLVSELERNLRMLDDVIKFQTVLFNDEVESDRKIDPSTVVFEAIEPPAEEEVDEPIERVLGLEEGPQVEERSSSRDAYDDEAQDFDDAEEAARGQDTEEEG
jgi:small subunit ribosomal protein S6